jgi:hypothetical protein
MKKLLFFLLMFLPAILSAQDNPNVIALQAMGSTIKAMSVGMSVSDFAATTTLTDNRIVLIPVYLQKAATITGVMCYMGVTGDFTADNNNKVGLYSVSGGTATLVASCANDANLWKATVDTFIKKAFSSTYTAAVGLYYVGILYNNSAQVAAPALGRSSLYGSTVAPVDFTNSNVLVGYTTGNDLTSPITMSTLTAHSVQFWVAIY